MFNPVRAASFGERSEGERPESEEYLSEEDPEEDRSDPLVLELLRWLDGKAEGEALTELRELSGLPDDPP